MINIPLVFWLVFISSGYYNTGSTTVIPVPFSSIEDCQTAGEQTKRDTASTVVYRCVQQRKADVHDFQSNRSTLDTFMDGE